MAVGRGKAPVAYGISDGELVYCVSRARRAAAEDEEQQAGGGKAEHGEAAHERDLQMVYVRYVLSILNSPMFLLIISLF
ncbi:MAG TPA: hypothetical protein VMW64_01650 [Dehalococcoidia bacterium]|nr:hypothetical protein [Dehalococcoidia bacterium]